MIDYKILNNLSGQAGSHLVPTREGLFTIKNDSNQYIHSLYSPVKEAQRLVEPVMDLDRAKTLFIIFGAGIGYHIEMLERAGFENIIIIERNPVSFSVFSKVYRLKSSQFVIGPDESAEKLDQIFSLLEIQNVKHIKTLILRGAYDKPSFLEFEDRIERLLKVKLGDFSTRLKFEELWFINTLKNLPNLRNSVSTEGYLYKNRNIPVLVVSAGPSLKDSLKEIKNAARFCIIIAVDTALLPLYEAGIIPDFVYSLDSQIYNLSDFSGIAPDYLAKTRLIYDIVVNPSLPRLFDSVRKNNEKSIRNVASNTAHLDFDYSGNPFLIKNELVNWIEAEGGFRIGDIETGGSVSTSSFHFGYVIGGNPLVLTGQDLAYTKNTSHSPSTSHFYRIMGMSSRLKPAESIFMNILYSKKTILRDAVNGGKTVTDFILNNFLGWFEESAKNVKRFRPDFSLVNTTISGARISNFEEMGLSDVCKIISKEFDPIERKKLHPGELIESGKVDKIIRKLNSLSEFTHGLLSGPDIFSKIAESSWSFLNRYFMKEKALFDRNEYLDKIQIERKLYRLIKTIEELEHEK